MTITNPTPIDAAHQQPGPAFHVTSISFRLDNTVPPNGWSLTHPYVEMFWLPAIGPTAMLMLRFVGRHVTTGHYKVLDPAVMSFSRVPSGLSRHLPEKRQRPGNR